MNSTNYTFFYNTSSLSIKDKIAWLSDDYNLNKDKENSLIFKLRKSN